MQKSRSMRINAKIKKEMSQQRNFIILIMHEFNCIVVHISHTKITMFITIACSNEEFLNVL